LPAQLLLNVGPVSLINPWHLEVEGCAAFMLRRGPLCEG
jgi:hypothetical protein